MTIIKPGTLPEDRAYIGKCNQCGCVVRFTAIEANTGNWVKCPTEGCAGTIYGTEPLVDSESLPWVKPRPWITWWAKS